MLSVSDVLNLPALQNVRVIAGHRGMSRNVRWVHVLDIPEIGPWLQGEELVLTTGVGWPTDPELQRDLMRQLEDKRVAAILFSVRRFIPCVPDVVLELGERYGIPVLEDPWTLQFVKVTQEVHRAILQHQFTVLERSFELHRSLTRQALYCNSLTDIARTLADLVHETVLIEDARHTPVAFAEPYVGSGENEGHGPELWRVHKQWLNVLRRAHAVRQVEQSDSPVEIPENGECDPAPRVVCPIRVGAEVLGYIWMSGSQGSDRDFTIRAVEHGGTVAALHILRERATSETESRLRQGLLESLITGSFVHVSSVAEQLRSHGLEPERPCVAGLLVSDPPLVDLLVRKRRPDPWSFTAELQKWFSGNPLAGLFSVHSDRVTFVCTAGTLDSLRSNFESLHQTLLEKWPKSRVLIVFGTIQPSVDTINESYRQAVKTAQLLRTRNKSGVFHYQNFHLEHLLYGDLSRRRAADIHQSIFGPLSKVDPTGHLRTTVSVLAQADWNHEQAAQMLYIHRNTLCYRIRQIEKALGMDLKHSRSRFQIQVALDAEAYAHLPQAARRLGWTPLSRHKTDRS